MSKCKRCGQCCERIGIAYSPRELRQAYLIWLHQNESERLKHRKIEHTRRIEQIWLIYPMLRYRGRSRTRRWFFYRCKHFIRKGRGEGRCEIYSERPRMCSGFPYYNKSEEVRIGQAASKPSSYKGCGYNG